LSVSYCDVFDFEMWECLWILGILEFNPQLAGQDITPANLEFGSSASRRRDRREKSFSGASALQGPQLSLNAIHRASFGGAADESIPLVCWQETEEEKKTLDLSLFSFRRINHSHSIPINQALNIEYKS